MPEVDYISNGLATYFSSVLATRGSITMRIETLKKPDLGKVIVFYITKEYTVRTTKVYVHIENSSGKKKITLVDNARYKYKKMHLCTSVFDEYMNEKEGAEKQLATEGYVYCGLITKERSMLESYGCFTSKSTEDAVSKLILTCADYKLPLLEQSVYSNFTNGVAKIILRYLDEAR